MDTKRKTAFLLFFASIGLRLPLIQTYIAKNPFIILIIHSSFFSTANYPLLPRTIHPSFSPIHDKWRGRGGW